MNHTNEENYPLPPVFHSEESLHMFLKSYETSLQKEKHPDAPTYTVRPVDVMALNPSQKTQFLTLLRSGQIHFDLDTKPQNFTIVMSFLREITPDWDTPIPEFPNVPESLYHLFPPLSPSIPLLSNYYHIYYKEQNIPDSPKAHSHFFAYLTLRNQKRHEEALPHLLKAAYFQSKQALIQLQLTLHEIRLKHLFSSESLPKYSTNTQLHQAHCYLTGIGRNQSPETAVKEYKTIIKNSQHTQAALALGMCYIYGIGVAQDEEQGVRWLTFASKHGNATASCELALCYLLGRGVIQNFERMFKLLLPLANDPNSFPSLMVSMCYAYALGTPRDIEKSKEYIGPNSMELQDLGNPLRRSLYNLIILDDDDYDDYDDDYEEEDDDFSED